ncbi:MAG: hypothetical protein LM593_04785 [Candidatus Verstraetearchaeota archaeon]|jgi:hypothetical protein|nr:hypothetical protein [Candidatus Verstraetearchaeota archaeon]
MNKKGITIIYDLVFAFLILIIGISIIVTFIPYSSITLDRDYQSLDNILIWLDSNRVLASCIYTKDINRISYFLDNLLPNTGYCIKVYSLDWNLIWSYSSLLFNEKNTISSHPYFLSGFQGIPNPCIVILIISR